MIIKSTNSYYGRLHSDRKIKPKEFLNFIQQQAEDIRRLEEERINELLERKSKKLINKKNIEI